MMNTLRYPYPDTMLLMLVMLVREIRSVRVIDNSGGQSADEKSQVCVNNALICRLVRGYRSIIDRYGCVSNPRRIDCSQPRDQRRKSERREHWGRIDPQETDWLSTDLVPEDDGDGCGDVKTVVGDEVARLCCPRIDEYRFAMRWYRPRDLCGR